MSRELSEKLLSFINNSPTAFHAVANLKAQFADRIDLDESEDWSIKSGKTYCVTRNGSSVILFRLPKKAGKSFLTKKSQKSWKNTACP